MTNVVFDQLKNHYDQNGKILDAAELLDRLPAHIRLRDFIKGVTMFNYYLDDMRG